MNQKGDVFTNQNRSEHDQESAAEPERNVD